MQRSILTEKVARRGYHITREYHVDPFALTRAHEVMSTPVESVPATMTLHGAAKLLTNHATAHPSFPVVTEDGKVIGIVNPPAVLRWRRTGKHHRRTTLGELLQGSSVVVAYPNEYLEQIADRMSTANVAHVPVVTPEEERLVGYISWRDLMRVRLKQHADERQRTALLPLRRIVRQAFSSRRSPS